METKSMYRHELKFLLDYYEAELIRSTVASACFLDEHVNSEGFYDIKSIYFDTLSDKCLHETLDGVNTRHKYRIRRYEDSNEIYKFEKKISENGLKCKRVDTITKEQIELIVNGLVSVDLKKRGSVVSDFLTENLLYMYRPIAVIGYKRIPYVYPIGNVRVTFDMDIVASRNTDAFFVGYDSLEKKVLKDMVVLEVKYDSLLPQFIRDILNSSGILEQNSFSKYAMGRLELRKGMYEL